MIVWSVEVSTVEEAAPRSIPSAGSGVLLEYTMGGKHERCLKGQLKS